MKKKFINLHEGLMSDTMPEKIVDLNDGQGGFVYNFDIQEVSEEVTVDPAEEEEEPHTATVTKYRHSSLIMTAPKTQNHILETLLSERIPINREQKLLNDYNAAMEGILPESAKDGYLEFLVEKKDIKERVEADCAEYGIPND